LSRRLFHFAVPALLLAVGASQVASGSWIHAKALLAQALLEYAWRCTLDGAEQARPWPWADTWPVARLSIPRLDAAMIVLAGDTGRTLAFGPGHTHGSALPGTFGTAIVNGHRDTHFAVLRELESGDELLVERRDGRLVRYVVDELAVADSRTAQVRAPDDASALVLITCWPFDALRPGGPMRYVVTARAGEHRRLQPS
jgi:sortase A